MAAVYGKLLRIKKGNGASPEVFTAIGGARAESFTINNSSIDITTKDSNDFRYILANAGVKTMSMSVAGVFTDSAAENAVVTAATGGAISNYQIYVPGLGTFTGPFKVSNLQINGNHDGAVEYSASFESAGAFAFVTE